MNTHRTYTMSARADSVAETRDRIARRAMELFFDQPYEDVTLAAIAGASRVSHQTVLNHFESKEGVALAVGDDHRGGDDAPPLHGERRRRDGSRSSASRRRVRAVRRRQLPLGRDLPSGSAAYLAALLDEAPHVASQRWLERHASVHTLPTLRQSSATRAVNGPVMRQPTSTRGSCCAAISQHVQRTRPSERSMSDIVAAVLEIRTQQARKNR